MPSFPLRPGVAPFVPQGILVDVQPAMSHLAAIKNPHPGGQESKDTANEIAPPEFTAIGRPDPTLQALYDHERSVPIHEQSVEKILLAGFLGMHSNVDVLRHFLGYPIVGAPSILDEAIIIGIDTEWYQHAPRPITELGMAILDIAAIYFQRPGPGIYGDHAVEYLNTIGVFHLRIKEHAHLHNNFQGAGNPDHFCFGTSVFVKKDEAAQILAEVINPSRYIPLAPMTQPKRASIILVGHAIDSDFAMLKQAIGIDPFSFGTIVKVIDTQVMARELGISGPKGPNISLKHLLQHFRIQPINIHNAGNDIAYTMIAAVLLSLNNELYGRYARIPTWHIQHVVNHVMCSNKGHQPPAHWGPTVFCTRCDSNSHLRAQCRTSLLCTYCANSASHRVRWMCRSHKTEKCAFFAKVQVLPST